MICEVIDCTNEAAHGEEICNHCIGELNINGALNVPTDSQYPSHKEKEIQAKLELLESKLKDPFHLNFQLIEDTRIGLEKENEEQAARVAELERWHKNNVELIAELVHQVDEAQQALKRIAELIEEGKSE